MNKKTFQHPAQRKATALSNPIQQPHQVLDSAVWDNWILVQHALSGIVSNQSWELMSLRSWLKIHKWHSMKRFTNARSSVEINSKLTNHEMDSKKLSQVNVECAMTRSPVASVQGAELNPCGARCRVFTASTMKTSNRSPLHRRCQNVIQVQQMKIWFGKKK